MKKLLAIVFALTLCLCACTPAEPNEPAVDGTGDNADVSTSTSTLDPTDLPTDSTTDMGGESVTDPSQTDDSGLSTDVMDPSSTGVVDPSSTNVADPTGSVNTDPSSTDVVNPTGSQVPGTQSTNVPGTQSTNVPGTQSTNLPGTQSTNVPGTQSTNVPGTQPTNLPGTQSTNVPGTQSTNVPGTSGTQGTKPTNTSGTTNHQGTVGTTKPSSGNGATTPTTQPPVTNTTSSNVVTTVPTTSGSATKPSTTTTTRKPVFTTSKTRVTTTTTTKITTQPTTKPGIQLEASELQFFQNIVDTENAWLASMQLSNGALPMTPTKSGSVTMNPYFADFAAMSLLNQADKYASNVKKYMDWHFNHLNTAKTDYNGVDGTIYDYTISVSNGKVTGESTKKTYDSTDSYAATFLMVLQKYVEKTGDKAYIIAHKSEIERVVNAMFSTEHNGLTLAKPDYAIKYLMDNCEVYAGMVAGEKLYSDVLVPAGAGSTATRDKLKNGAKAVADKIEDKMWTGSFYYPALGTDDRSAYTFNWTNFYPSATSQMFPIIFGLIDPSSDRAKTLYNTFCQYYDWENHDIPDSFYWGSNLQAAAKMGDVERMKTYLTAYQKVAMRNHNYPLYNSDAAKVCMAAYEIIQMAG